MIVRRSLSAQRLATACLLVSLAGSVPAQGAEAVRFREGRYGRAELRYVHDLPVLIVEGTPAEMGRQQAALVADRAKGLLDYPKHLMRRMGREDDFPALLAQSAQLLPQFPCDHLAELDAFARQSGVDRRLLIGVNAMVDVYRGAFGCSSLLVEPQKSVTQGPLFGRNLDFYPQGHLEQYSLVTVYRPAGKHAFASIGFPGLFGCLSGMNEAGLALATHEVFITRDGSPMLNPRGVPYTLLFRRILEECATVQEAAKLLQSVERTTLFNLALCDPTEAAVAEVTPRSVVLRHGEGGVCACTNHFRTDELGTIFRFSTRHYALMKSQQLARLDVADVAKKLHEVNAGAMTMQTMVFEPAALRLHLAIGVCPSSALPLKDLELGPLLKPGAK
jgi:isopenicillin-N N-acyltransferase like protein